MDVSITEDQLSGKTLIEVLDIIKPRELVGKVPEGAVDEAGRSGSASREFMEALFKAWGRRKIKDMSARFPGLLEHYFRLRDSMNGNLVLSSKEDSINLAILDIIFFITELRKEDLK